MAIPRDVFDLAVAVADDCVLRQRPLPPPAAYRDQRLDGLPTAVLHSIYRQRYQMYIRQTAHLHRRPEALADILSRYEDDGESILEIARSEAVRFSPYLTARLVMEHWLSIPKSAVADLCKKPQNISDKRLQKELLACIDADEHCSPLIDRIKSAIGDTYELLLDEQLRNRGIPHASEEDLRIRGFAKTPDARLDVPIGIRDPCKWDRARHGAAATADTRTSETTTADPTAPPRIVHWIDSKATFGDPATHRDNMEQMQGYVNRFGPGLVIYWGGYVAEIADESPRGVAVASRLPPEWVLPGDAAVRTAGPGPRSETEAALLRRAEELLSMAAGNAPRREPGVFAMSAAGVSSSYLTAAGKTKAETETAAAPLAST